MINADLEIPAPVLYVRSQRARRFRITVYPDPTVTVTVPKRASLEDARSFVASKQKWILRHLRRINLQAKAVPSCEISRIDLNKSQNELFERLEQFSRQHNLPYRRVAFRCQKTKWGSCSSDNNISLNINIIFLPSHLQDYILIHELVHIHHKNHSTAFWTQLNHLCNGKARLLSKELHKYRMQIKR